MITVYKRKGSPFWYFDVTVNGHRRRVSTKRVLKREAEAVADAYRTDALNRAQLGQANREVTIRQALVDHFLPTKAAHTEYRQYKRIVSKLLGDVKGIAGLKADIPFHEMTNAMLVAHRQKRLAQGAAAGTVDHEFKVLSQTHHLIEGDYRVNPKLKFPIERRKGKPRFFTPEEEEALLKDLDPGRELVGRAGAKYFLDQSAKAYRQRQDNYDLVVMLLDTGTRFGELAKLTWDMVDVVDWKWVHIYRWKVSNEDQLAITDRMRPILQRRFKERTSRHYVFPGWREQDDGGEAPRGSTRAIRRAMKRIGINDAPKVARFGRRDVRSLRDTFATKLRRKGMSLDRLQKLLGHSSPEMTQKYADLTVDMASTEAVEILNSINGGP